MLKTVAQLKIDLEQSVPNAFTSQNGGLSDIPEAMDYIKARCRSVIRCLRFDTEECFVAALSICMDCLKLDRLDRGNFREWGSLCLLRLNRDQDCYNFIKWWSTSRPNYDWKIDMRIAPPIPPLKTFLNIKNADVLEDIPENFLTRRGSSLIHRIMLAILKYKAVIGVQTAFAFDAFLLGTHDKTSHVRKLSGMNNSVLRHIHSYLDVHYDFFSMKRVRQYSFHCDVLYRMFSQLMELCRSIHEYNPIIWDSLVDRQRKRFAGKPFPSVEPHAGDFTEAYLVCTYLHSTLYYVDGFVPFIKHSILKQKE